MSDVKAAAERLRRLVYRGMGDWVDTDGKWLDADDMAELYETLAQAYLAEHPPDDDTPIDENWLRAVGFERPSMDMFILSADYVWWLTPVKGWFAFVDSGGSYLCFLKTRVDVRHLCAALGITLKESEASNG